MFVAQPTMNNVLLEEIGGAPLPVRPIPYVPSAEYSQAEKWEGRQVAGRGAAAEGARPTQLLEVGQGEVRRGLAEGWRGAFKGVAAMGCCAIVGLVLVAGRWRGRGGHEGEWL